jgi:hypothetical protein
VLMERAEPDGRGPGPRAPEERDHPG